MSYLKEEKHNYKKLLQIYTLLNAKGSKILEVRGGI